MALRAARSTPPAWLAASILAVAIQPVGAALRGAPSAADVGGPLPELRDSPGVPGWLVERLYHAEPIVCPWQRPGEEPDADCAARAERITALRRAISTCEAPLRRTNRSMGHRGAPLVAPEETVASWKAGARSGAGWLECDASLTKDMELACRHGTCDLAFTTDLIARHPELSRNCSKPWVPGSGEHAVCCTYDFTLEELGALCGVMESIVNASAESAEGYLLGAPGFRSSGIAQEECHRVVPYGDYLRLLRRNGYSAIPELKDTMEPGLVAFLERQGRDIYWLADKFAEQLTSSFRAEEGIAQTFDHRIAEHWRKAWPAMRMEYMWEDLPAPGRNCTLRNGAEFLGSCAGAELLRHLAELGVHMFSPPIQLLIASGPGRTVVPSETARLLRDLNVQSIGSWSLERQGCNTMAAERPVMTPQIQPAAMGPCGQALGGYYGSVENVSTFQHADVLQVLDVLFKEVGIAALFSDFPATVSAYANCVLAAEEA